MIKIFGCGDFFISKRLPENGYKGFDELQKVIASYDVKFCNLETTIHNNEGYPSAFPGGGWGMSSPECLKDVKRFGFNMLSVANNHTMDYSHKGLEATLRYINQEGLLSCGAGRNLTEASLPRYVECADGRVGFIAVTSSFHDSDAAGYSNDSICGRPGVNPLRHTEIYQITSDLYQELIRIAEATGINDTFHWSMKNGYMQEQKDLFLRNLKFRSGSENKKISYPLEQDMDRVKRSIQESNIQADCTVVSFHSHQMMGDDETPDIFIVDFCHQCIDAGADIILGHGSHILRGIEIYKGKPIFYGLGDFVLHNEMPSYLPQDFYEKYNVPKEAHGYVGMGIMKRSENGTKGLSANPKAWESIAVGITFENDNIDEIRLYPIRLGYELGRTKRGWPVIDTNSQILKDLAKLSKEKYGTSIAVENGLGIIKITD